jgi:hypothetical protein
MSFSIGRALSTASSSAEVSDASGGSGSTSISSSSAGGGHEVASAGLAGESPPTATHDGNTQQRVSVRTRLGLSGVPCMTSAAAAPHPPPSRTAQRCGESHPPQPSPVPSRVLPTIAPPPPPAAAAAAAAAAPSQLQLPLLPLLRPPLSASPPRVPRLPSLPYRGPLVPGIQAVALEMTSKIGCCFNLDRSHACVRSTCNKLMHQKNFRGRLLNVLNTD